MMVWLYLLTFVVCVLAISLYYTNEALIAAQKTLLKHGKALIDANNNHREYMRITTKKLSSHTIDIQLLKKVCGDV